MYTGLPLSAECEKVEVLPPQLSTREGRQVVLHFRVNSDAHSVRIDKFFNENYGESSQHCSVVVKTMPKQIFVHEVPDPDETRMEIDIYSLLQWLMRAQRQV